MSQGLRLVLFGPPGAGKGTQSQLLIDQFGLTHVSSGDLFRYNLRQGTPLGLQAKSYMDQGALVPDHVTVDIILEKVMAVDNEDGLILDGFPRNIRQAVELESSLKLRSRGLDKVVHIDVPLPVLERRLGGRFVCRECQAPHSLNGQSGPTACSRCGGELYQRDDDQPEAVNRRIDVYREETMPLLDFYRERDLLAEIAGDATVEEVNQRIVSVLDN